MYAKPLGQWIARPGVVGGEWCVWVDGEVLIKGLSREHATLVAAAPAMLYALREVANIAEIDTGPWARTIKGIVRLAIDTARGDL
jgi:hypothetical protein